MRPVLILLAALLAAPALAEAHGAARQFAQIDADQDGRISAQERAGGARRMFVAMDANGDGSVNAAEMKAAHKAVTGKAASKSDLPAADKIRVVDADGDGSITAAEHASASVMMFKRMDVDQHGTLTRQQLAAGHAAMLTRHGCGGAGDQAWWMSAAR